MKSGRGYIESRGREKRKRNPIVLYAAEGKNKTEMLYMSALKRNRNLTIELAKGNETDPVNMMIRLKSEAEDLALSLQDGDRAYCFIDTDTEPAKQKQIDGAFEQQDDLIKVILSSPCFEVWFLCHYRYSTRYMTSKEAIAELKRFCSGYEKNKSVFDTLEPKTQAAIKNAKKLARHHDLLGRKPDSMERNPSSDIYKVVEYVLSIP